MIKVAEWIRVSDESQAAPEKFGIPAQKTVNRDTCKRLGLEVIETFQVEDVSGKDIMLASETHDLIRLMKSGRIQGVVAREFSRLMRPDDFADFVLLSEFQKTKTILYLPEGSIDFNDKMGRLMAGMQASISGYERSTIRERLHRGNEENRKSGGRFASHLPKGVGHSKAQGWFYTDESQQVLRAYEMVLAGDSVNDIAKFLGLSATGARYLIHNPIYKGWRVYERECGEVRVGKNGRQAKYRPLVKRADDKVISVKVIDDPLISPETWEWACKILDMKSESCRRSQQEGRGGFASYNGFLFCDECGRIMSPFRGSGHGYYCCLGHYRKSGCSQRYTRVADMEKHIDALISTQMNDPAFLRRIAMQLQASQGVDKRASQIEQLEGDRKSLERKRQRVVDMYADGDINKPEKDERLTLINERLAVANDELSRLQQSAPATTTAAQLAELFAVFVGWDTRPKNDRRKLLSLFIPRMRVRDGKVVSVYRLLAGSENRYDSECSSKALSHSEIRKNRYDSECSRN